MMDKRGEYRAVVEETNSFLPQLQAGIVRGFACVCVTAADGPKMLAFSRRRCVEPILRGLSRLSGCLVGCTALVYSLDR